MIHLFSGDDVKNKRKNYEEFMKSLSKDIEVFFVGKNDFNQVQTESFYSGSGLFFAKCAVVFTNIFEKEETRNFVLEKLELMNKSGNIFIFLEGKLDKATTDAFKKARAELNVFELPKAKKEKYDNFLLANAFGRRDKLNLWIHFRRAIENGVVMEELVGVLFWKAKEMLLKKNFNKFSETELQNLAGRLSYLLPEARKEGKDVKSVLERFLLEAF
ncbi:MAG: hypothetical protein UT09_C0004G0021 [Parcubacteria group bacterium GW2011_GWF2_38_8]|nr:MAG: hypothetical protein UT09_C0004G0021 [Parcubacteria group bacterium GW2011_GWF2_38_8]